MTYVAFLLFLFYLYNYGGELWFNIDIGMSQMKFAIL